MVASTALAMHGWSAECVPSARLNIANIRRHLRLVTFGLQVLIEMQRSVDAEKSILSLISHPSGRTKYLRLLALKETTMPLCRRFGAAG